MTISERAAHICQSVIGGLRASGVAFSADEEAMAVTIVRAVFEAKEAVSVTPETVTRDVTLRSENTVKSSAAERQKRYRERRKLALKLEEQRPDDCVTRDGQSVTRDGQSVTRYVTKRNERDGSEITLPSPPISLSFPPIPPSFPTPQSPPIAPQTSLSEPPQPTHREQAVTGDLIEPEQIPDIRKPETDPVKLRLFSLFGRKPVRTMTKKELKSFKAARITIPELEIIEEYYCDQHPEWNGKDVRRRSLETLLNNWSSEVDKAENWDAYGRVQPKQKQVFSKLI